MTQRFALLALTAMACIPAALAVSANWIKMGGNDSVDAYMDLKLLEKKGDYVVSWRLYDYRSPQKTASGKIFRSAATIDITNCLERTEAMTQFIQYDRPMGKGNIVDSNKLPQGQWEIRKITPNSIGEALAAVACGRYKMWNK